MGRWEDFVKFIFSIIPSINYCYGRKIKIYQYKFQNLKHFWLKTKTPIFSAKERKSKNIIYLNNHIPKTIIVSSWTEVPWISKRFLLSKKQHSGAAFPWLNDKTHFAKLGKCLNLYCSASSHILPTLDQ